MLSARRPRLPHLPIGRARLLLVAERAYAAFWALGAALAALLAVALLGLHEHVPAWVHLLGLVLAIGTLGYLTWRGASVFRLPSRREAVTRLEQDNQVRPGTFQALDDTPFEGDRYDPYWRAHIDRLRDLAVGARLGSARADIDRSDPLGTRFMALFLLAVGLIVAGDLAGQRLEGALRPRLAFGGPVTADIWIDPPAYTGQAPILLVRSTALPSGTQARLDVPEGSVLRIRLNSVDGRAPRGRASIVTNEDRTRLLLKRGEGATTAEAQFVRNAALVIASGGNDAVWPIGVRIDEVPTVALTAKVSEEGGTRLVLPLETEDDYGIAEAELVLRLLPRQELPADVGEPDDEVLTEPIVLPLPEAAGVPGRREPTIDLSEHVWAGLSVALSVRVTDGAGQSAETKPVPVRLPAPRFYDPLARTVIEQRRHLAAAPSSWARTARMLDALTLMPERFAGDAKEYLLLRTAYHDMLADHGRDVASVTESFLPLARALEDEGLQLAKARLDEAAAALREALDRGATDDELGRLIDDLRQAMNDYVAALAASGDATGEGDEQLGESDLDDMLDAMRNAAERGATEEARDLLSQLENMMQNLAVTPGGDSGEGSEGQAEGEGQGQGRDGGQGQAQGSGEGGSQGGALGRANDLIEGQRGLSDETFAARRGERDAGGLAEEQRALRDQLEGLAEGQGTEGQRAFEEARRAMEGAANALERGELGAAQALQESAIESLTEGAERLAEAAREGRGEDGSTGQAASQGESGAGRDPLGRPYGRDGQSGVEIPDLSDPERLREVIETLRRRVADPTLSEEERRYLESLLERF